jgi:gamma-glutamylaminecyclotransferase
VAGNRLFVYGTLRRGERAHGLLARATFLGNVRTEAGYQLRDLGPFPALVRGGGASVTGELYVVSRALLLRLDRYEGVDYLRSAITLDDGTAAEAYLAGPEIEGLGEPIRSGDWFDRNRHDGT